MWASQATTRSARPWWPVVRGPPREARVPRRLHQGDCHHRPDDRRDRPRPHTPGAARRVPRRPRRRGGARRQRPGRRGDPARGSQAAIAGGAAAALDQAAAQGRFDPGTSSGFVLRDPPVDRSVVVRFRGTCLVEEARTVSITAEAMASLDTTAPLLWFGDTSAVRMRPRCGHSSGDLVATDADVFIDGSLAGRSPFERNVCVGERRVRVRHRIGLADHRGQDRARPHRGDRHHAEARVGVPGRGRREPGRTSAVQI